MLDKLTAAVLEIVNEGSGGAYKVMDADDFLPALKESGKDGAGLESALRYLGERGYIDIPSQRQNVCGDRCRGAGGKKDERKVFGIFFRRVRGRLSGRARRGAACGFRVLTHRGQE